MCHAKTDIKCKLASELILNRLLIVHGIILLKYDYFRIVVLRMIVNL